jgi:ubiquinone/menaquinone biosynthesis C-methylase UbiE
LRRTDYRSIWDWQARSAQNARLAVAGTADIGEHRRTGTATAERLTTLTGIDKDCVVLEIGCGTGRVGLALAPVCRQWIGTDVSPRMLKHAHQALSALPNVQLQAVSGFSLQPIGGGQLDVVYCTGVFMHLDEWERFRYVQEAHRVLRPGGRVYVDNMNLLGEEGWQRFMEVLRMQPRMRPPQVSKTSTPQELSAYLERAGFVGIHVESGSLWVSAWGTKP